MTVLSAASDKALDKQFIIEFFDRLAPQWDAEMRRSDEIISIILDNAGVAAGKAVLDVACGTGVLIPDYLQRHVASVTAIDISPRMVELAKNKFSQENVKILCGDVEEQDFGQCFDCIIVYNAFPHFPDPERLVARLAALLKPEGILTVAHGMSREKINSHHSGMAGKVSQDLMCAEELATIFARTLAVTTVLSDDRMYQVAGKNGSHG